MPDKTQFQTITGDISRYHLQKLMKILMHAKPMDGTKKAKIRLSDKVIELNGEKESCFRASDLKISHSISQ